MSHIDSAEYDNGVFRSCVEDPGTFEARTHQQLAHDGAGSVVSAISPSTSAVTATTQAPHSDPTATSTASAAMSTLTAVELDDDAAISHVSAAVSHTREHQQQQLQQQAPTTDVLATSSPQQPARALAPDTHDVPSAAPAVSATIFTRAMEDRLKVLHAKATAAGRAGNSASTATDGFASEPVDDLTDDEQFEYEQLQNAFAAFEEEGRRNLAAGLEEKNRAAAASSNNSLSSWGKWLGSTAASTVSAVTAGTTTAVNGAFFWTSLLATAGPGLVGRAAGITPNFLHWNGVIPNLILGALPVITQLGGRGNHLKKLHGQLNDSPSGYFAQTPMAHEVGLVVACLTQNELDGFGVPGVEFAQGRHWNAEFGMATDRFLQLEIIDNKAATNFVDVDVAVARMHHVISRENRTVYVHCKAGKGRSWMLVMCYLTTFGGMAFEAAKALVKERRNQVNPSATQEAYVHRFLGAWLSRQAVGSAGEVLVNGKPLSQQ